MSNRVRVFIASSLDGFIAGPNDEIDWLSGHGDAEDTYSPFIAEIGAMLMGRRTFDVVAKMKTWPYGDLPVLVATNRPMSDEYEVRAICGKITSLVDAAKAAAGDKDVYIDGGALIRSALDAGLIDEITVTWIPMILGKGKPLFAGVAGRHSLELVSQRSIGGGLVEVTYRPRPS